jgi:inorganic pyrophosphatase
MKNTPQVEVIIEIPRGSFRKFDSRGRLDYISPVPCPFNYGSVADFVGPDGDPLDAVILGRRLSRGTRLNVRAIGAVRMSDRGVLDDKLICSHKPVGGIKRTWILLFFRFYAACKGLLNTCRGYKGRNRCLGWLNAEAAIKKAENRTNKQNNLHTS